VNSMIKCNTQGMNGFGWGLEPQAFAGPGVQPIFNFTDLMIRDDIQVGAFRQEPADEAVGVFDGRFFPRMPGITEVGGKIKEGIEFAMEDVFGAIVISDGLAEDRRDGREDAAKGKIGSLSGFVGDFGQAREAGLALHSDFESSTTPAHDEVCFPMAGLQTEVGLIRSKVDGNAAEDHDFRAVHSAESAVGVLAREEADQMRGFPINPLVNGLRADDFTAPSFGEPACDNLGRPFSAKPTLNLRSDPLAFEALSAMTLRMPQAGEKLCPEGMVMLLSEVAPDLPGEGGRRPSQGLGDGPEGLPAFQHDGKDFPLFFVHVCVGFHRPPFYPTKPLHQVLH